MCMVFDQLAHLAMHSEERNIMKTDIHPNYDQITATCSCGNKIEVGSTLGKDINLDICSECHPIYTGKQKTAETGGRVDKFRKRFAARSLKK